jgi:hypothetical protein
MVLSFMLTLDDEQALEAGTRNARSAARANSQLGLAGDDGVKLTDGCGVNAPSRPAGSRSTVTWLTAILPLYNRQAGARLEPPVTLHKGIASVPLRHNTATP